MLSLARIVIEHGMTLSLSHFVCKLSLSFSQLDELWIVITVSQDFCFLFQQIIAIALDTQPGQLGYLLRPCHTMKSRDYVWITVVLILLIICLVSLYALIFQSGSTSISKPLETIEWHMSI